jgi:aminoglycoside 6-adenylyltransferase
VSFEEIERRFTAWAETRPDIRAACVLGSRARKDRPADEWSDLDILVLADDPDRLLQSTDWIGEMGDVVLTFLEPTPAGDGLERRVLYEGGRDVDYSIFPASGLEALSEIQLDEVSEIVGRGMRILLDREGALARLADTARGRRRKRGPPSQEEFVQVVNDFWYHAVWAAKKLRRGEILMAKGVTDAYLKRLLVRMLALHAQAADPETDTWHDGRFFEQWTDPRALEELRHAYARYDAEDVARALPATMRLFRWVAQETADRLGLTYPAPIDQRTAALVERYLAQREGPP